MLDLQRHMYCPIWTDAAVVQPIESPYETTTQQWTGLKYACQKVLETYCKLFDEKELYDLIVRYIHANKVKIRIKNKNKIYTNNFI